MLASLHDAAGHDRRRLTRAVPGSDPPSARQRHRASRQSSSSALGWLRPGLRRDLRGRGRDRHGARDRRRAGAPGPRRRARARAAVAAGVTVTIDSDCHRVERARPPDADGVGTARRGWVEPDQVLNTRPLDRGAGLHRRQTARPAVARSCTGPVVTWRLRRLPDPSMTMTTAELAGCSSPWRCWAARPVKLPRPATATEVAGRLQKKYDRVRDFSADFAHTTKAGRSKRIPSERGTVLVKKPGKMRWEYKPPEEKVFVSDGARDLFSTSRPTTGHRQPGAGRTTRRPRPSVPRRQGQPDARLQRDATSTGAVAGHADAAARSEAPQRDYDWLEISSSRETARRSRRSTAADKQGGRSTFQFTNFKENAGLADKDFEFKIPRGADVINTGSANAERRGGARSRWRAVLAAVVAAAARPRAAAACRRTRRAGAGLTTARSSNTPRRCAANPDDDDARLALERAKLRASQEHSFRGRRLRRPSATRRRWSSTSSPPS